ncbi:hypothetical protein ACS0TY_032307 [Phlomoides rotata]
MRWYICSGEYADDTVFICSGELKNILLIKRLLILFELSSGLNVNFDKSCLHEIQISNDILSEAANILNCKLSKSVFSYLGMEIGVNHHKPVAWEGLIQKVKNCLATWDDKLISFAGQRESNMGSSSRVSPWWGDICKLYWAVLEEGVRKDFVKRVGNGTSTKFWLDLWVEGGSLKNQFHRLFRLSNKNNVICETGRWENSTNSPIKRKTTRNGPIRTMEYTTKKLLTNFESSTFWIVNFGINDYSFEEDLKSLDSKKNDEYGMETSQR